MHVKSSGEVMTDSGDKRTFQTLIWHSNITTDQPDYNAWKENFRKFSNAAIKDELLVFYSNDNPIFLG